MWPSNQRFLPEQHHADLVSKVRQSFEDSVAAQNIEADLSVYLDQVYLPLSSWLLQKKKGVEGPLVLGICGGQGSGKSTSTALLASVLRQGFACNVAVLSIDDIYKTRAEREQMGREIHPLFVTRGVPMTHDVELGVQTIDALRVQSTTETCRLPLFDKSRDDRSKVTDWPEFKGSPDIIVLEGWFVGAVPEDDAVLGAPINVLERDEDADGRWRAQVNAALKTDYQALFDRLDVLLLLKVESMKKVFTWRRLQERKLALKVASSPESQDLRVMTKKEVDRFIMHYERLTRHILQEMPSRADIVFEIDDTHNPASVVINRPISP